MKIMNLSQKLVLVTGILLFCATSSNAQFLKKLGKTAERAAERAVERRVDREATEKTDQALDSILEPGSKKGGNTPVPTSRKPEESTSKNGNSSENAPMASSEGPKSLEVYSKFDYVPGDVQLFFDDFANDFVGDFPSKWDTNGTGEVVTIGSSNEKWFEVKSSSVYFPNISNLPEDYTIEFDILTLGLDDQTSSTAILNINLEDEKTYDYYRAGNNAVNVKIPFAQYADIDIRIWNKINKETLINNNVQSDIRKAVLNKPHISIAVNGQRFRLWVNETKYVDVPKLVAPGGVLNFIRFEPEGLKDGKDRIFIGNLKVAKGGEDLRRKLLSEGKISTNAILFNSGSDQLKPESMGVIRQIFQVLEQDSSINLKIVGHTDSDGAEDTNMKLSKNRAEAVKSALVSVYGVDAGRLSTDGKGESEPVGDNSTSDGKSQNRRVEFIKL
ncbi:OmpA family protein [Maribacter flavus]|uniref:OmpA family protein n=1 Tax=Maribacter flavus TaxID=1658664 RepID=A0A5B2TZG7_9FLAO|nr:OmpA family protein [Maribacter flavus]KAA2219951.1 OmpA family protein [Maribacter flavus]